MADMSLTPAFNYYLVSHELWGTATGQISDSATRKLHYDPTGRASIPQREKPAIGLAHTRRA